jgi:hypothetical protein
MPMMNLVEPVQLLARTAFDSTKPQTKAIGLTQVALPLI